MVKLGKKGLELLLHFEILCAKPVQSRIPGKDISNHWRLARFMRHAFPIKQCNILCRQVRANINPGRFHAMIKMALTRAFCVKAMRKESSERIGNARINGFAQCICDLRNGALYPLPLSLLVHSLLHTSTIVARLSRL